MADDYHYVPGDFYRLDDRSGFKVRANRMRKEWTELIVDKDLFELRPPQDFVKGVIDDQTVPEPRPRPAVDPTVGPLQVILVPPPSLLLLEDDSTQLILEFAGPNEVPRTFLGGDIYVYPAGSGQ